MKTRSINSTVSEALFFVGQDSAICRESRNYELMLSFLFAANQKEKAET